MDVALQAAARQDYALAENAYVAAIRELEMANPNDPRLGPTINSLGLVFRAENKSHDAELAFRRAGVFIDKANTPNSIDVGNSNLNIGTVLVLEGKYNEAEPFLQKAFRIYSKQLGDKSPKTAAVMGQLGEMYRNLNDPQAESLLKKALDIQETARGIDDPDVAVTVNSLAELYASEKLLLKAEPMFKLVMSIRESTSGMDSVEFAAAVERYAAILEKLGRFKEAERHRKLALAVRSMKRAPAGFPVKTKGAVDLMAPTAAAGPTVIQPAPLPMKHNGNQVAKIQ
jgi:tetratricopeptide (TPR) repeat protein